MNKSSSSASSSPPFTTLPPPPVTTSAAASNQGRPPSVIPLDYNYNIMPPSSLSQIRQSTTSNATRSARSQTVTSQMDTTFEDETQYNSLFGDPVPPPPPTEFLESELDSRTSRLLHTTHSSFGDNGSFEEEAPYERALGSESNRRLFSNVPYTSLLSRRSSNTIVSPVALPRLQPPDIQILPNSSGGSSSGEHQNSPQCALLAPDDAFRRSMLYNFDEPADVSEFSETFTINDASGNREFTEASRRMSNFNADFKANVGPLNISSVADAPTTITNTLGRQFSNESFSSSEWFRPALHDFPEFSKMPKLRPSSKNVMSIKRDEMPTQDSPVAAMLNDSNGSSSGGEERILQTTLSLPEPSGSLDTEAPLRPPEPSSSLLRDLESNSHICSQSRHRSSIEDVGEFCSPIELPPPTQSSSNMYEENNSVKREMSPAILRDSIATGSDYRVDGLRLHKKTSFTIISDRTPQSSRAPTPSRPLTSQFPQSPLRTATAASSQISTQFKTPKPTVKPRSHLQRKSLTSTELRMPTLLLQPIPSDDSPRPSVQFDMSRRYSPGKMPQKGILQHRESLSSSIETALPTIEQYKFMPPPVPRRRSSKLPTTSPLTQTSALTYNDQQKIRSYETLPLITDPYRTAIPRFHRSSLDIRETAAFPPGALPRPLKPNPNPTRSQRGLLRIINSADSVSRIPLRSNWTASADDLTLEQRRRSSSNLSLQTRRRSSSTSPERRSSTQTVSDRRSSNLSSVTTSDFSFRRPSVTGMKPLRERRKSIFPGSKSTPTTPKRRQSIVGAKNETRSARTKIAKPTTLSPIIGTPNKDSSTPQSPVRGEADIRTSLINASETLSDSTSRRGSVSKIPIPNGGGGGSHSNSRLSSLSGSRVQSRSSSPLKELLVQSPNLGRTSRATSSRSPSRSSFRSESRPVSRADSRAMVSRSSSRASTRPISREPTSLASSRPSSRIDSRPNSRMEQARDIANSRFNTRVSQRSSAGRATSISPSGNQTRNSSTHLRRKSVSLSPVAIRRSGVHRRTTSPTGKKRSAKSLERRSSQSRIPTRTKSDLSSTRVARTSTKQRAGRESLTQTASTRKKTPSPTQKQPKSAKKVATSIRKPESSVKRSTSSVSKAPSTATKKTPTNVQKTVKNLKPEPLAGKEKRKIVSSSNNTVSKGKIVTKPGLGRQQLSPRNKSTLPESKELKKQISSKQLGKSSDAKAATSSKPTTAEAASSKQPNDAEPTQDVNPRATEDSTQPDESTIAAAATATGALIGGMKRQPSTMSLIRMGSRLSLLSRKRPDSSLSRRHITEEEEDPNELSEKEIDTSGTNQLHKVSSSGQIVTPDGGLPAVILEKSQKTLENIQKTVTVATDEIQRKISENLTDLKTLEQDMGRTSDGAVSPTASVATVVENRGTKTSDSIKSNNKSPQPMGQPIEAYVSVVNKAAGTAESVGTVAAERVSASTAISVLPEVDCESANFQNFDLGIENKENDVSGVAHAAGTGVNATALTDEPSSTNGLDGIAKHRQSPDGQGGSTAGSDGGRTGSRELLDANEEESPRGCCRCCARFCMPCRRSRCSLCCRGNKKLSHNPDESEDRPVLSATSSTTTTNLEVIDEVNGKKKNGCWQKLNCFKRKIKSEQPMMNEEISRISEPIRGATPPINMGPMMPPKQGKCGACLRKILCCRSSNKVETTSSDDGERVSGKCCACFPCCRKKPMDTDARSTAWQDPERGITATDFGEGNTSAVTPEDGCCKRFWRTIFCCCCRKKQPPVPSGSRRPSIKPPPVEDTRRKLHNDLVEYTSKMKGAIPVLPLYLAWFCAICNTIVPGLGTLFSGLFCICVGIPRFSQYDSAKARLGSFIINTIVAAAQLFCVLFCFVGWGWSIWWGTIMLKCAKKLSKIRKVERLEMEEEQRQAAAAAAAARAEAMQGAAATETTKT